MKSLRINQIALGLAVTAVAVFFATSCQDEAIKSDSQGKAATAIAANCPDCVTVGTEVLSGALSTRTLYCDTLYILDEFVSVPNGVTLTINAGTRIQGTTGTLAGDPATGIPPGTLIVERGGNISANGTASCPIVFTSNETTPQVGDWGGVIILGHAPVCFDGDPEIEGIPDGFGIDRGYGGNVSNDNSGNFQYVRIEYAGNVLVDGDETNGLTLGGVGSGTVIDHVQVTQGADDAFEFFGGTVNASFLIASSNTDDDYDTDQGYSGQIQFAVSYRNPSRSSALPTNGFESNGDDDDDDGCNLTSAKFSNVTIIGPVKPSNVAIAANYRAGALIRDGSELDIYNSIIVGYPVYQFELELPAAFGSVVEARNVTLVYPTFSPFGSALGTNVTGFTTAGLNNENLAASVTGTSSPLSLAVRSGLSSTAWAPSSVLDFLPNNPKSVSFTGLTGFSTAVTARGAISSGTNTTNWNTGWEANF